MSKYEAIAFVSISAFFWDANAVVNIIRILNALAMFEK